MKILGIETSCDETACAVVEDGRKVLANVIASQIDIHAKTGGVVPEVAAREHVLKMIPVLDECLQQAFGEEVNGKVWDEIDAIAITKGPGLVSSLIIGTETANVISYVKQKPLVPVQHIVGHIYSNWLEVEAPELGGEALRDEIEFPVLILTVSGGHNEIILMRGHNDFEVLGETRDDAAGEAFDKVAKMLGLGYPGGPAISKIAEKGDCSRFDLPRPYLEKGSLDFSFSGLKTAVLAEVKSEANSEANSGANSGANSNFNKKSVLKNTAESNRELSQQFKEKSVLKNDVEGNRELSQQFKADLSASFQEAVVDVLSEKLIWALKKFPEVKEVHLAGGVSANLRLRECCQSRLEQSVKFRYPKSLEYCTDNAAMIAAAGFYLYQLTPDKFKASSNFIPTTSFEIW